MAWRASVSACGIYWNTTGTDKAPDNICGLLTPTLQCLLVQGNCTNREPCGDRVVANPPAKAPFRV